MDYLAVVLIGVGLAMDAFAVSICKGMAAKKVALGVCLTVGIWFGFFQFLMPLIGYAMGTAVYDLVSTYAPIIAFAILLLIGLNMIREGMTGEEEEVDGSLDYRTMFVLAIATSIDALAVGVSMAMEGTDIFAASVIIGVVTFFIAAMGAVIGSLFGNVFGRKADMLGGCILILIGAKILLEAAGFL